MPGIAVNSELDNFNASVTYPIWFTPESGDLGVNVPTLITEWSVEARLGGIYVVRLIHILAASSGDWDNPLESIEPAWPSTFRKLSLTRTGWPQPGPGWTWIR